MNHELPQVLGHPEGEAVAHLPGKEHELVPAGLSPLPRLEVHQGVPDQESNQGPVPARKLPRSQSDQEILALNEAECGPEGAHLVQGPLEEGHRGLVDGDL